MTFKKKFFSLFLQVKIRKKKFSCLLSKSLWTCTADWVVENPTFRLNLRQRSRPRSPNIFGMTFDLISTVRSLNTPPQCGGYRYSHLNAIGPAVSFWKRANGKFGLKIRFFTDLRMNIRIEQKSFYGLHCPIYTVLPWKFQSSISKIDKVIAANMGQEERKKERTIFAITIELPKQSLVEF